MKKKLNWRAILKHFNVTECANKASVAYCEVDFA